VFRAHFAAIVTPHPATQLPLEWIVLTVTRSGETRRRVGTRAIRTRDFSGRVVLDLNLNGQSARPVAEPLAARKVPFVIVMKGNQSLEVADRRTR